MADKRVPRRRLAKKKPSERALMGVVRVVDIIGEGGEIVRTKGVFPAYPLDRREMNDRGFRDGDVLLMDFFKDRNPRFWRKFHALSFFISENVAEMEGLRAHTALKKVQLEARQHCELVAIEPTKETAALLAEAGLPALGWQQWSTKSLNFDDTDEALAESVWEGLCDYVARTYFKDWDASQVAEAAAFWEREQ